MNKLCRAQFKYENKIKHWLIKFMYNFAVHSNEITCIKVDVLGWTKSDALHHVEGKRVLLTRGIHQALEEFRWLAEDLSKRPTRLYAIVPFQPTLDGYHDASGSMYRGAVLPGLTAVPCTPQQ